MCRKSFCTIKTFSCVTGANQFKKKYGVAAEKKPSQNESEFDLCLKPTSEKVSSRDYRPRYISFGGEKIFRMDEYIVHIHCCVIVVRPCCKLFIWKRFSSSGRAIEISGVCRTCRSKLTRATNKFCEACLLVRNLSIRHTFFKVKKYTTT